MGEPEAVELLYPRGEQVIGFPADAIQVGTLLHLRPNNRGNGGEPNSFLLSGTAFVKHDGIDVETSRRWKADTDKSGVLYFRLSDPSTEVIGNRARSAASNRSDVKEDMTDV